MDGALSGHAAAETYSVLTRLPGDARLAPADAARLIAGNFDHTVEPTSGSLEDLPAFLAARAVFGGAVHDALAAVANDVALATRDERARAAYQSVGARVAVVG